MSSTIIAYTIIGSKIDRSKLFTHEERSVHRVCPNAGTATGGAFCAACGKPVDATETITTPVKGFEPEEGTESQGLIGGLDIIPIPLYPKYEHFLAVRRMEIPGWHTGRSGKLPPNLAIGFDKCGYDIESDRREIRAVLEPLGLWEPENFGIWTALYYS